jgi:hypothetical protein
MAAHNRMLELSLLWTEQSSGYHGQNQPKADATQIIDGATANLHSPAAPILPI